MKFTHGFFPELGLTILFAASLPAQQVKTDYDRNANFSRYQTYSWQNVHTQDPLLVDRIKAAVNSSLRGKGWTQVESGGDIAIMAMEMTAEHQTLQTYYDNFGGGWGWQGRWGDDFGTSTTTEQAFTVGTVVVDLFDAGTKMLVWRGSASGTVSAKSNRNIKKLERGVEKMFEHFPPQAAVAAKNRR